LTGANTLGTHPVAFASCSSFSSLILACSCAASLSLGFLLPTVRRASGLLSLNVRLCVGDCGSSSMTVDGGQGCGEQEQKTEVDPRRRWLHQSPCCSSESLVLSDAKIVVSHSDLYLPVCRNSCGAHPILDFRDQQAGQIVAGESRAWTAPSSSKAATPMACGCASHEWLA
jgi:hypothetical protein